MVSAKVGWGVEGPFLKEAFWGVGATQYETELFHHELTIMAEII